jgi:hypothetical protein
VRFIPLLTVAAVVAGCSAGVAPIPQIIYVTPAPTATTPAPTSALSPTSAPTPIPTAPTHQLKGTLTIGDGNWTWDRKGDRVVCQGNGGYADVHEGTQLQVQDGTGTVIGMAELVDGGTVELVVPSRKSFPVVAGHCTFSFEATVPDAPFYTFKVGRRDAPVFANTDLNAKDWKVELTLGV